MPQSYYNRRGATGGTPPGHTIDYVPTTRRGSQAFYEPISIDAEPMGGIRRGLWMYTHKLGLNFSLVLFLSLCYQGFMAVFIGMRGVVTLPIFSTVTSSDNQIIAILGTLAAIFVAGVIQGLIIAEMAQVVWLRHPDKLKVRLMSGSVWWWVMLAALIFTIVIDFLLLFLAITSTRNLAAAWSVVQVDQMSGLTNLLLAVLNVLTLLRCASVMRTSTSEEIRQEVEEKLKAIAEEILLDAGESARQNASKVYKNLGVDPQRFVPLQNSVLNLISTNHPEIVPPQVGGTWAYDFAGNTLAAVPPDMFQALMQNRYRIANQLRMPFQDEEVQHLWKLPPRDLAEVISYNLDTYGSPIVVDARQPDQPNYINRPLDMSGFESQQQLQPSQQMMATTAQPQSHQPQLQQATQTAAQASVSNTSTPASSNATSFVNTLSLQERSLFIIYLINVVFPFVHKAVFPAQSDVSIFDVFDEVELQWYYRHWKKNGSTTPLTPSN